MKERVPTCDSLLEVTPSSACSRVCLQNLEWRLIRHTAHLYPHWSKRRQCVSFYLFIRWILSVSPKEARHLEKRCLAELVDGALGAEKLKKGEKPNVFLIP